MCVSNLSKRLKTCELNYLNSKINASHKLPVWYYQSILNLNTSVFKTYLYFTTRSNQFNLNTIDECKSNFCEFNSTILRKFRVKNTIGKQLIWELADFVAAMRQRAWIPDKWFTSFNFADLMFVLPTIIFKLNFGIRRNSNKRGLLQERFKCSYFVINFDIYRLFYFAGCLYTVCMKQIKWFLSLFSNIFRVFYCPFLSTVQC